MIALPESDYVTCPTCKGSGQRQVKVRNRTRLQTCLACAGEGRVEADRVCGKCGRWLDGCVCIVALGREPLRLPRQKKHTLLVAQLLGGTWVVRRRESAFYSRQVACFEVEAAARTFADQAQYENESAWPALADKVRKG